MTSPNAPLPVLPTPELMDPEWTPLLSEPFVRALASTSPPAGASAASGEALRRRLLARTAASRAEMAAMVTVRQKRCQPTTIAAGVSSQTLYAAPTDRPLREGEPLRTRLIELQPGANWQGPTASDHREWLVMKGSAHIGGEHLQVRDFHVITAGHAQPPISSSAGALLFLRESRMPGIEADQPFTVRDPEAGWPEFAPGIRRRVLWQHGKQAALLYHAEPGASVPMHTHGHDEECLMLQGEFFLDDVLLQAGDYQLAPAGTGHRISQTDTGVVIYAHGDLDLQFVS